MVTSAPSKVFAALAIATVALSYPTLHVAAFSAPRYHNTPVRGAMIGRGLSAAGGRDARGQRQLRMSGGGNDGGVEDPNPGGMTEWDDDDDKDERSFDDLSFIEQVQEWFASPEGKEDVKTYTLSLSIALLLRFLIIEPRYIPSLSMYPTFEVGDQLAVEKVTKRIRPFNRNEVVVFNPPQTFRELVGGDSSRKSKEALIKRIIAIEVSSEGPRGLLFTNHQVHHVHFS